MPPEDPGHAVQVRIAPDRMSVTLVVEAGAAEAERAPPVLEALLDERGLARSAERSALVARASEAAARGRVEMAVMHGRPPAHGRDARLELDPALSARIAPVQSAGGRVDHHQASTLHVIRAGDLLGRVLPATPGVDGEDVTGRALAARQGRAAHLLFDETIRVGDPDGRGARPLTAARDGVLVHHGDLLRVSGQFDVPGDVDFSVGNIDFPGDVRVGGGVRDQFVVRAGGSLEVRGLVEAATIHAGHDVRLVQGMAGREKGSLEAGRDCEAKYLEGLRVSVGRDAAIGKEVTNSHLRVGRHLRAPACAVIGGALTVAGDCELAQLGSEARVATEVTLGKLGPVEDLLRRGVKAFPALEERLRVARDRLEQIRRATGRMTPAQAEELTELEFAVSGAASKLRLLGQGLARAAASARQHGHPRLTVHRMLFPGVRVWIGRFVLEPRAEVRGPFELTLGEAGEAQCRTLPHGHGEPAGQRFRVSPDDTYVDLHEVDKLIHRAAA